MGKQILKDITNYLDFLNRMGFCVSISRFENRFEPFTYELTAYDLHTHPVCFYVKTNQHTLIKCSYAKRDFNHTDLREPLYTCCFAGVEQYIIPVMEEDTVLLHIYLSGYRDTLESARICSEEFARLCGPQFQTLYNELSPHPPALDAVMQFVAPLCYMIKALYQYCLAYQKSNGEMSAQKQVYLKTVSYIHSHLTQTLSSEILSEKIGYSSSYLRYVFQKEAHTTINQWIRDLRLQLAKNLILHTNYTVIEIASQCGFSDSNYFSTVFKEKYGLPPLTYRKTNRT